MRAQTINLLYATFEESIKRLGSFPLDESPKIKDLAKTRKIKAAVQLCYREMRKGKKAFPVLDYLCIISTRYLLQMTEMNLKISKEKIRSIDFAEKMLMQYSIYPAETKNFLRYFSQKPDFFLSKVASFAKETKKEQLKTVQLICGFWYFLLIGEKKGKKVKPEKILDFIRIKGGKHGQK